MHLNDARDCLFDGKNECIETLESTKLGAVIDKNDKFGKLDAYCR
jgi:hypothetical protein